MKMPWECPKCRAENGDGNVFCLHCGTYNGEVVDSASVDMRQDILAEASAVLSERQDRHGQAEDSFGLIAAFWSAYLGVEISKRDASIMMALFKLARGKVQPANRDNDRDAIGYMAIAADRCTLEGLMRYASALPGEPLQERSLAAVLDGVTAAARREEGGR